MRFEVPQFIEIEDKIFGPLSWRQFLYLGGGIGMAVVIFLVTNWVVFLLLGLPIALLSLALSFYPVNNRPFSYFLEAVFNYLFSQRMYFWRRKEGVVYRGRATKSDGPAENNTPNHTDISSMARKLELEAMQKNDT